jgi:membrane protease subunit HflC
MRQNKLTVLAIAVVALALLAFLVVYCVPVDKMAVHYRLNKVRYVVKPDIGPDDPLYARAQREGFQVRDEAGWFFKVPLIDHVRAQDKRIRVIDGALTQQQLADNNQIIPRVYVTWRVTDPVAYERNLRSDEAEAVKRIKTITGSQSGSMFGRRTLEELVNTDPDKLRFDDIEEEILYGLEVTSLGITWIAFPQDTTKAVYGRMQAERRRAAEMHRSEGQKLKSELRAEATEKAEMIIAQAEAESKSIKAQGEAEAAEYYDVFAKHRELSIFLDRLETLERIAEEAARAGQPLTMVLSTQSEIFKTLAEGAADMGMLMEEAPPETVLDQNRALSPPDAPAPAVEG